MPSVIYYALTFSFFCFQLKEFTAHTNMQGSQFFQQARERVENNIHFMDRLLQAMELWLGLDPPAASFPHPIPPWR